MRHPVLLALCLTGTAFLAACNRGISDAEVQRAVKDVNVIDESNLNDIMLTVGDPNEAVAYFQGALQKDPDRPDLMRGLAKSLVKAGKPTEAALVWQKVVAGPKAPMTTG
jgi:predicted Zn-dependent protease